MALSKEQIDILADNYIVSLFQGMESEVINDIARRINKAERYTETAEIQARNLRDLGYNTQQIQTEALKKLNNDPGYKKMIALNTKEYKAEVKQIIEETEIQARINGEDMIAQAGDMAWNDDLQMWAAHNIDLKKPSTLSQMKKAFVDQTNGSLRNITQTTAFMGTQWGNTGVINAYQKAMDMTVLKVTSGVFSYQQAVTDTIKALSQGLATVDYASGRKYHVDTAARMTVRTAASQLAGKITEENIKKTGVDLVYVDAHPGARPSHADWQGQVYSYSGNSKKYKDFYNTTDYGSITGLKGINCTHNFWPYWEGDPIPAFKEPAPVTIGNKSYTYYEAAQKQRGMERNIRATKRQLNAMQALNDPKMAQEIQNVENSLKKQIQDYNKFSHKAGIDPQSNRLRVYDSLASAKSAASKISLPIETRTRGMGSAASVAWEGAPLSKRQERILEKIKEPGTLYEFTKREISMGDLAALTAATNREFTMFTLKNKRSIMMGDKFSVDVDAEKAKELAYLGYRWSGHTHPGTTFDTRIASEGDKNVLKEFYKVNGQKKSLILNSLGNRGMVEI